MIVLLVGSAAIGLSASGLLLAGNAQLATVRQTIDAGWRGTYDILVRPSAARSVALPQGEALPYAYLGDPGDGITREQWGQVQAIPGVDVAAPVSSVGWFTLGGPGITVNLKDVTPDAVYRLTMDVVVEGRSITRAVAFFSLPSPGGKAVAIGAGDWQYANNGDSAQLNLGQLPSTWGLVTAIDPLAEDRLVGLSGHLVDGTLPERGLLKVFDSQYQREATQIPVLVTNRSPVPGTVSVAVQRIDGITAEQLTTAVAGIPPPSSTEKYAGYQAAVVAAAEQVASHGSTVAIAGDQAALSELVPPLRAAGVSMGPDGKLVGAASAAGGFGVERTVVLQPGPLTYATDANGNLDLEPRGTWDELVLPGLLAATDPGLVGPNKANGQDEPMYRSLRVTKPPPYLLEPVGVLDLDALDKSASGAVNYVPLGIYGSVPRSMAAADGSVGQPLPPSLNPGGINPPPPLGITNLEAAEFVRGAKFIDAIRVRVGGIVGYDGAAVRRIEDVAAAIHARTGLRVDVVAGASPLLVPVEVPAVGRIVEPWTTLGTAPALESAASGSSLVILLAAVGVAAAYLLSFGAYLAGDQAFELAMLARLGWRRRDLARLTLIQALLIGFPSALVALSLTVVLSLAVGQPPVTSATLVMVGAILLGHLLAGASLRLPFVGRFRRGASPVRRSAGSSRAGIGRYGMALLSESPGRMLLVVASVAVAVAVSGIVALIAVGAGGAMRSTLLGQLVAVRIGPYHLLATAGALLAAVAIVLNTGILTVERRLSAIGSLRAAGWRGREVRRLIFFETGAPAAVAGAAAGAVILAAGAAMGHPLLAAGLGLVAVPVSIGIAILASLPAANLAARVSPMIALRAEGATGGLPTLTIQSTLLTVGLVAVFVTGISLGWTVIAPPGIPPSAILGAPPPLEVPEAQQRIVADATAIAAWPDRSPGSDSLAAAMLYSRRALEKAGYEIETQRLLVRAFDVRGPDGPIKLEGLTFAVALTFQPSAAKGSLAEFPVTLVSAGLAEDKTGCPRGAVLLRIGGEGEAPLAARLARRCQATVPAVLAVIADDANWATLTQKATTIRFPVAEHLIATLPGHRSDRGTPWLVASLDSVGPGASQSAAPVAVLLEAARQFVAAKIPVRIAITTAGEGTAISGLTRLMAGEPAGPAIFLGPLGGTMRVIIGSATRINVGDAGTQAGLLSTVALDEGADAWLLRIVERPDSVATSDRLLSALVHGLGYPETGESQENGYALAVGIDGAYVGEPQSGASQGSSSVSGTTADRAEQLDGPALLRVATGLVTAVTELDGNSK